ncbi:PD-(D/E)XK nuclease family protein [bacterium]|nr:PD-(D/E)XK nuclease family protein [bacterium]
MESLFSRLQSYRPQEGRDPREDFFTEAFCYVLDKNKKLLKEYIKFLTGKAFPDVDPVDDSIKIETQRTFKQGRPDVVITFKDIEHSYMIICEHKLGAEEGENQLKDYFNILYKRKIKGALVFITKYHVSTTSLNKNGEEVDYTNDFIKEDGNIFALKPLRWSEINTKLKEWEKSVEEFQEEIYKEFLEYMEELGMAPITKFSALEMAEFCRIPRLLQTLDECLLGEAMNELRSFKGRSIALSTGTQKDPKWSYGTSIFDGTVSLNMGVYLSAEEFKSEKTHFDDPEYPELIIYLSSDPKNNLREKQEIFCKKLSEVEFPGSSEKWIYTKDVWKWWMVISHKSMRDFIQYGDNQIEEIQKWFAEHLRELKNFIDENEILS